MAVLNAPFSNTRSVVELAIAEIIGIVGYGNIGSQLSAVATKLG